MDGVEDHILGKDTERWTAWNCMSVDIIKSLSLETERGLVVTWYITCLEAYEAMLCWSILGQQ